MNERDSLRYDVLIYGLALAAEHGKNTKSLRATLEALGVTDEGQLDGVREAIKDCLRPVYGF